MDFNTLDWHDAIILKIEIDRQNPGNNDTISMIVKWPNGSIYQILFEDVYWANLTLNFGVIANESIRSAHVLEDNDKDLISIYSKWGNMIGDMKLIGYFINTNSTNSNIKIIALGFKVVEI
jgi:hypothetical protein